MLGVQKALNRGRYRKFIKFVLSDFCLCYVRPKIKAKKSKDFYLVLLGFFKIPCTSDQAPRSSWRGS